ncbi:MAG: VCBS repeat-containing protein [Desulfovibrionaceae bacterium]
MKLAIRLAIFACVSMIFATQAWASPRTYMVFPFTVEGPQGYGYLEKAIPSTLSARLLWQDKTQPVKGQLPTKAPASESAVAKAQSTAGADFAVWGKVVVIGNDCTLEVKGRDATGKVWNKSAQSPVNALTTAVQKVADGLSADMFGRPVSSHSGNTSGVKQVNQMNSAIVVNETGQQEVYLNPQFRYQGAGAADGSRLTSSKLPFTMVDFAVGKFSGNGKNEVAVLGEHKLHIYAWEAGKLKQLAETTISMSNMAYSMRMIDLDRNGTQELVISTFQEDNNRPYSFIYTFAGGKLREYCKRSEYFMSVAKLPPNFTPTLIGQGWDSVKLFQPGVHMMIKTGDKYTLGTKVALPEGANVFNFAWMPGDAKGEGDRLMILNAAERIKVYTAKGNQIHQTMEQFSGSSAGMEHFKSMPGLGIDSRYQLPDKYYAPMRLIAVDLEHKGEYVLLVNKPISTASQFFNRYRFFPQGEVHALYWDGVGMGLKWKTRRIRGSVTDIDIADLNNDGVLDLIVGLNTHPGALGVSQRQSMITAYPLDLGATNPNTAPDMSEFEQ